MSGQIEFYTTFLTINGCNEDIELGCYFGGSYSASILPVGFSQRLSPDQALRLLKALDVIFAVKNASRVADEILDNKGTIRTICRNYGKDTLEQMKDTLLQGIESYFTDFYATNLDGQDSDIDMPAECLEKCKEYEATISEAICLINSCLEYLSIGSTDELKKKARSEVQRSYDRIFMKLGREHGFQCLCCGNATADLQIDHVVPVSLGGTSEIENLQLLCRKCNADKGTQTVDYRPKQEVTNESN